jgi:hypothetical protein
MKRILGMTLLLVGAAVSMFAQAPSAPEIDPSSGITALALLSGGLVVFWGSRRSK